MTAERIERVREACRAAGRDPAALVYSVALTVCCAADPATLRTRTEAIGRPADNLRTSGLYGTPGEIVDRLGAYHAAGVSRVYLQLMDVCDLAHAEELAAGVLPAATALGG